MNGLGLLGLVLILYAIFVFYIAATKKPTAIWNMAKIQLFIKTMGEMGTRIFFFIFGGAALAYGIYLLMNNMPE